MFESLFYAGTETGITPGNLLVALVTALMLGFASSLVSLKTGRNKPPAAGFTVTLVVLPAVVTVIILLVGNNVARAFSLAGAFAIIRFRSEAGGPKDITYVLFSMAIGLSCGMGFVAYAAVTTVLLCGVMILLECSGYGQEKSLRKLLKITAPEHLDHEAAFADLLSDFTAFHTLHRIKTVELGSLYQFSYEVVMKAGRSEKEFIDALRCRNGNLTISLGVLAAEMAGGRG